MIRIKCECCGHEYKVPDEESLYSICPKCKWEQDGTEEINDFSSANGCTLLHYRLNNKIYKYAEV